MQTLIPEPATAAAQPTGRTGSWAGYGLTPLTMLLLLAGFLAAVPPFWHPRLIWLMFAYDGVILVLAAVDASMLPAPRAITVTRSFLDSPEIGQPTRIELAITQDARGLMNRGVIDLRIVDDLHPSLVATPVTQRIDAYPRDPAILVQTIYPRER